MSEETLKSKIISFLADKQTPTKTLVIAKAVVAPTATRKDVNPILYAMEKEKLVIKTCEDNGTNPQWSLVKGALQESSLTEDQIIEVLTDHKDGLLLQGLIDEIGGVTQQQVLAVVSKLLLSGGIKITREGL